MVSLWPLYGLYGLSMVSLLSMVPPFRFSSRTNSTDLYHVTRRHWTSLRFRDGAPGAPPVGFHSAVRIGPYMVLFGTAP